MQSSGETYRSFYFETHMKKYCQLWEQNGKTVFKLLFPQQAKQFIVQGGVIC